MNAKRKFELGYAQLIASAIVDAQNDNEFKAAILETIARSLGRSVTFMFEGDAVKISDYLETFVQYAFEEAASVQKAALFISDPANWQKG